MSKKRDWVDYANLASNVAQNVQLDGIQDRLSGVQNAAAAQAQESRKARQAIEQAEERTRRLANYREIVVQGERALAGLRHHLPKLPLPVLARALGYRHQYEENRLGTGCFESFEDKDRVERLLADLNDIVDASSRKLSAVERREAQQCLQYELEGADLKELVAIKKRREEEVADLRKRTLELNPQIAEFQRQLNRLDNDGQAELQLNLAAEKTLSWGARKYFSRLLAILTSISVLALAYFVLFYFYMFAVSETPDQELIETRTKGIGCSLLLTAVLGSLTYGIWPSHGPRSAQFREEKVALQKRLTELAASLSKQPSAVSDYEQALYQTFGGDVATSSSFYEKMQSERRTFVSEVNSLRYGEL